MTSGYDRQFSFDDQFPSRPPGSLPDQGQPRPRPVPARRATTRGQGLSWMSFVLAVLGSVAVGFGLYYAIELVHFRRPFLDDASSALNLALVGACVLVVAFGTSVVALVRARPKRMAAVALAGTLLLPVIAAMIGIKFGLDALLANLQAAAVDLTDALLHQVVDAIRSGDILEALRLLLDWFLRQ
jgi:hypothetical protein